MRGNGVVIAVIAALVAVFGGTFWAAGAREREGWRLCDEAIQTTLKAPSTYRRIDGPDTFVTGTELYRITYDAQNSFGVALRSQGFCRVNEDRTAASWTELPASEI
jgi:hypothetical protein